VKQFIQTDFFLLLKGNGNNPFLLENKYEKFACHLFAEGITCIDKTAYRNILVYNHVELTNLTGVSKKNRFNLS
jgi:hypothetical protein